MLTKIIFNRYCSTVINNIPLTNLDENLNIIKQTSFSSQKETKETKVLINENYLDEEEEWENDVEGVGIQEVELILTLLNKPEIHSLIYCGLYPLINTLTHLIIISYEQVKNTKQFKNK